MGNEKLTDEFLVHCRYERGLNEKTLKAYRIDLSQYTLFLNQNNRGALQTDKDVIRDYIQTLHGRVQPKSIKRKMAVIKTFYNYLELEERIPESPFRRLKTQLKIPKKLPGVLDLEEIQIILKYVHRLTTKCRPKNSHACLTLVRDRAVLELLFATGMRVGELSSLKKENVDTDSFQIRIQGKGNRERLIRIFHEDVKRSILEYSNKFSDLENPYFFVNRLNNRLSEQSIRFMIKKHTMAAGIRKHVTPHFFRHTFATLLLDSDVDIRHVQELLGHSSIVTTQIYTHVSSKKKDEILNLKHPRGMMKF